MNGGIGSGTSSGTGTGTTTGTTTGDEADSGPRHLAPPRPRWGQFLAAVLATLLVGELVARVLAPNLDPVYRWPRGDYVEHQAGFAQRAGDLQLLVVGSSIAGRAIRPDGIAAAGGPGPGYNFWLAGPPMRSTATFEDHLRGLEQSSAFKEATGRQTVIGRVDDRLRDVSDLARYRATLRDPSALIADLRRPQPVFENLGPDGFLLDRGDHQLADEPPAHLAQERAAMAGYRVAPADVEALGRLLDTLRSRRITALVVNLPVTPQFIALADGGARDYDSYVGQVSATTAAHGGTWLDAMAATTWPDRYFGDIDHLNDAGTARLQPLVLAALAGRTPRG